MTSLFLSTLLSASAAMAMDMSMSMATTTTTASNASGTAAAASATSTAMSMSMGGSSCKISMLWNWNTIDTCFIARSWHVRSNGMFAGSCIGVILLVMLLEFLRRSTKEFDRWLIAQHIAAHTPGAGAAGADKPGVSCVQVAAVPPFRPNLWQQGVRAFLHVCQFSVAYFVMLLAMYYNGYFIICIFIGAYLGAFVFQWETINISSTAGATSAANEATVCCG